MSDHRPGSVERILDAAANRAREGLRVVEDYTRFVLADDALSRRARDIRHGITELVRECVPNLAALRERDTPGDLGADPQAFRAGKRAGAVDIVTSALKRAEEALRSLAEFALVACAPCASRFESLRYATYDLERETLCVVRPRSALRDATVAVHASLASADDEAVSGVAALARAGCHALVIDGARSGERAFLAAARALRAVCDETGTVFLVAGRPDVARLAAADGVLLDAHCLSAVEARRVLPHGALVVFEARTVDEADRVMRACAFDAFFVDVVGEAAASRLSAWREACHAPWFAAGFASVDDALAREGLERVAFDSASVGAGGIRRALAALPAPVRDDREV